MSGSSTANSLLITYSLRSTDHAVTGSGLGAGRHPGGIAQTYGGSPYCVAAQMKRARPPHSEMWKRLAPSRRRRRCRLRDAILRTLLLRRTGFSRSRASTDHAQTTAHLQRPGRNNRVRVSPAQNPLPEYRTCGPSDIIPRYQTNYLGLGIGLTNTRKGLILPTP